MTETYSTGRPRLYWGMPEWRIRKEIEAYERYAEDYPEHPLSAGLRQTAEELREELELRKEEEIR